MHKFHRKINDSLRILYFIIAHHMAHSSYYSEYLVVVYGSTYNVQHTLCYIVNIVVHALTAMVDL